MGVNTLDDNDDFGLAELGRLEQQYGNEPAAIRELRRRRERAHEDRERIIAWGEQHPTKVKGTKEYEEALQVNSKVGADLDKRLRIHDEASRERLNRQAVNVVGREYSERAVGSYVSAASNSLEAQVMGARLTTQGYASLASQRTNIMNQMSGLRQESKEAAGSYLGVGGVNIESSVTLQHNAGQMKELAQQLVPITLAMQQLKQQGLDPMGRQRALIATGDKAAGVLNYNRIEDEMRSGQGLGAFSPAELKKKEAEAAEKLLKALEELRNSAGKTAEELDAMNENAEKAAKEFEDIKEARGVPGGGDNRYENAKVVGGTLAEAAAMIASLFQNIMINQPMQMVQNVTASANMENEKYGMWHRAVAGDMTARMTLGAWKDGHTFGEQQADRMGTVHGLRVAGGIVAGGLGIAQMGEGVAGVFGDLVGQSAVENVSKGAKSTISGFGGAVQEGLSWHREIEQARLRIDSTMAVVQAAQALNHISGQQLQGFRGHVMGVNETAGLLGGDAGEAFLGQTGNAGFLRQMAAAGIGPKEFAELSGSGAAAMGSMFNASQVFGAARLEKLGFGTADANMKRMGILGASGMGDPGQNLAKLIEEGMQRGLNSSKAIDMIVENTARMTEETAMRGGMADPSEYITKTILGAMDKDNPNRELAAKIAYQTYQTDEGARHNIAASFPGLINVDRNMKALGLGTDRLSASVLTNIPTAMLNAYKANFARNDPQAETKLREMFAGQGVNVANMDPSLFAGGKIIDIMNKNASIAELAQQSGAGFATGQPGALLEAGFRLKDSPAALAALITGRNDGLLSPEDKALRAGVAAPLSLNNRNPAAVIANAFAQAGIALPPDVKKTLAEMDAASGGTNRGAATFEKRLQGMAESGQAAQGADILGPNAIKVLAQSGADAFKAAGVNAEKAWSTAAKETAENFGKSANLLDGASGHLEEVAKNLRVSTDAMKVTTENFKIMMKASAEMMARELDEALKKWGPSRNFWRNESTTKWGQLGGY